MKFWKKKIYKKIDIIMCKKNIIDKHNIMNATIFLIDLIRLKYCLAWSCERFLSIRLWQFLDPLKQMN